MTRLPCWYVLVLSAPLPSALGAGDWPRFRPTKRPENSHATPPPVTDGARVFAVFGDGSFAALDYAGGVRWTNRTIKHFSLHGLAASPILYRDLLIMPFDGTSPGRDSQR